MRDLRRVADVVRRGVGATVTDVRRPKAEALIPAADRAGLDLKVVVDGDRADGTAWLGLLLAARAMSLSRRSYRQLNPHGAVPSYLFVDGQGFVQAGGHVGDEDWRALEDQLGV